DRAIAESLGIVYTARGKLTNMEQKVKHRLSQEFGEDQVFHTEIPVNVDVAQAVDYFKPVVLNNPQASGSKAFEKLTKEFLKRLAKKVKSKR
ncbi:ParA family protein, partial [Spirulina sp. CS-785/01]|nr:ParA family protein [Spirulina sp. CS-785/01]